MITLRQLRQCLHLGVSIFWQRRTTMRPNTTAQIRPVEPIRQSCAAQAINMQQAFVDQVWKKPELISHIHSGYISIRCSLERLATITLSLNVL